MTAVVAVGAFVIGFYFGRRWERRGSSFMTRLFGTQGLGKDL